MRKIPLWIGVIVLACGSLAHSQNLAPFLEETSAPGMDEPWCKNTPQNGVVDPFEFPPTLTRTGHETTRTVVPPREPVASQSVPRYT